MFDAGVEILDVFTDDDEIDAAAGEGGFEAGQFAHGADVAVEFEMLAQGDVGGFLAVADRGFERALEGEAVAGDAVEGFLGRAGADATAEDFGAGFGVFPVDLRAGGGEDLLGCGHHFGTDAITGDRGNFYFFSH